MAFIFSLELYDIVLTTLLTSLNHLQYSSEVKQKNEAGLEFKWDEENGKNFITLEVLSNLDATLTV